MANAGLLKIFAAFFLIGTSATFAGIPMCSTVLADLVVFERTRGADEVSRVAFTRLVSHFLNHSLLAETKITEISKSTGPMAQAAALVIKEKAELQRLSEIDSRLKFAEASQVFLGRVLQDLIFDFSQNSQLTELEYRSGITAFNAGALEVVRYLESLLPRSSDPVEVVRVESLLHDSNGRLAATMAVLDYSAWLKRDSKSSAALKALAEGPSVRGSLRRLIVFALADSRLIIGAQNISIEIKTSNERLEDDNAPYAKVLEDGLKELIHNAAKYADPAKANKLIHIEFRDGILSVYDNGLGILDISKLGANFYREYPEILGTGHGLQSHFAKFREAGIPISVDSELGQWTRFSIDLSKFVSVDAP